MHDGLKYMHMSNTLFPIGNCMGVNWEVSLGLYSPVRCVFTNTGLLMLHPP